MSKAYLVVFILTLSALFPIAGYYLDWKERQKGYKAYQKKLDKKQI